MNPDRGTAYAAERLFDGERFFESHAVWVEDSTVVDVLPTASLPPSVPIHQYPDCTLIPGLIDSHVHFMRWQGPLYLAYGVTTVRDTGNDLEWILECRRQWQMHLWPRIFSLGPLLDGAVPNHPVVARSVSNLDSAAEAVRQTVAAGVDGIKLYVGLAPEWIRAMVRESHAGGLPVSMHCSAHGVLMAGRAGLDEFYHHDGILADIWPDHPGGWLGVWGDPGFPATWDRQQQVADEIAAMGMAATPTLAYWDSQWRMRAGGGPSAPERELVPPELARWASARPDPVEAETWQRALAAAQAFTGLLLEREVPVTAGSDVPCGGITAGLSLWRELALLAASGMSNETALRAGTSVAADVLRRPELGRLGRGRAADLALVRGDLAMQIPAHPEIVLTVRDGTHQEREKLLQAAAAVRSTVETDPWGRQFRQHWQRATNRATGSPGTRRQPPA